MCLSLRMYVLPLLLTEHNLDTPDDPKILLHDCIYIDLGLHYITVQKMELKEWRWLQHFPVG